MSARRNIDWSTVPLGTEPDTAIAERLGVNVCSVQSARVKRGIPRARKRRTFNERDWTQVPLGRVSDAEIARLLGMSKGGVQSARTKLGIPAVSRRSPDPVCSFDGCGRPRSRAC